MNLNIATLTDSLLACAVCGGGDDATTTAANFAIGFMGLLIVAVLGSLLKFMHYLGRQEKLAASEQDLVNDMTVGESH
jgi:hypothetical protein